MSGVESITLLTSEIPVHTHNMMGSTTNANSSVPTSNLAAKPNYTTGPTSGAAVAYSSNAPNVMMSPQALAPAGGSLPHNNMQPYLTLNFCIAMQGIFPQRP
jgi:microcystin-dependent protein